MLKTRRFDRHTFGSIHAATGIRHEAMLDDELIENKLTQLLEFVAQLKRTSEGAAEIKRRGKLFGACKRREGETSAEFYAKLRCWLDRDSPQTKSPFRASRQTD